MARDLTMLVLCVIVAGASGCAYKYISFVNWLPGFLTLGIYSPRTVYAVCSRAGEALP